MSMKNANIEKTVYFIRHGQSEANVSKVFQSGSSPLTEVGRKQADLAAMRASRLPFEALISSTFDRAKETASAISKATGKDIEYSDLFVERIKPSSVSGKPRGDAKTDKTFDEWEKSLYIPGARVEDGENYDDLLERSDKAIDFLTKRKEKDILVVTHGFFLRTIIARVLLGDSLTPDNFKEFQYRSTMNNTGLSAIKYTTSDVGTRWRLWIYNDHAHLA